MTELKNVALVFGTSGISGWAVAKCALFYPTPTTFDRVIGLTNRPLPLERSGLPHDPRLELYYEKVPNLEDVTHVYYLAYSNATAYSMNVMAIRDINERMTYNVVHAVDRLCKNMKFFVLQSGTNGDEIFYYVQVDLIKEANKGKSWKWCEVPPDQIVEAFNTADNATPESWAVIWPKMCEYFGLNAEGASPEDKGWKYIDKWWFAHQNDYKKMCEEYGLCPREVFEATWIFLSAGFGFLGRNCELSLDKIRSIGFTEEYPIAYGYVQVFDHLAQENIIPSKEAWTKCITQNRLEYTRP
ncbi:hypothetical protein N7537_006858 [Penicillium hordei]|uniref:PRISE-like Rossmann-fold domain-containing protein n=1 Tax=Penicillium hordei TaxID=40994 RepID=A0AAD6E894_9EURO|nr:uncharacterized protein N7537_006858 [Penicillium hordei]KAJ5603902.1 hypothetical protein N7537_006858 [Penicillium hordei]